MQAVFLHSAHFRQLMNAARQGAQLSTRQRGWLPGLERHALGIFRQQQRIQRVVLAALHHGLSKVPHRARIGHPDFDLRLSVQGQSHIQTVQACRLQTHAYTPTVLKQKTYQLLMTRSGVGKLRGSQLPVNFQSYHQYFGTDFHSGYIELVHPNLLEVGCSSGFPILYRLRSSLNMQA